MEGSWCLNSRSTKWAGGVLEKGDALKVGKYTKIVDKYKTASRNFWSIFGQFPAFWPLSNFLRFLRKLIVWVSVRALKDEFPGKQGLSDGKLQEPERHAWQKAWKLIMCGRYEYVHAISV